MPEYVVKQGRRFGVVEKLPGDTVELSKEDGNRLVEQGVVAEPMVETATPKTMLETTRPRTPRGAP